MCSEKILSKKNIYETVIFRLDHGKSLLKILPKKAKRIEKFSSSNTYKSFRILVFLFVYPLQHVLFNTWLTDFWTDFVTC